MDIAYKRESDASVKERILLVRRFNSDAKEVAMICKEELHRSKGLGLQMLQMVVKVPKRRLGRFKRYAQKWKTSRCIRREVVRNKERINSKSIMMEG
jgi:hypothetical protein